MFKNNFNYNPMVNFDINDYKIDLRDYVKKEDIEKMVQAAKKMQEDLDGIDLDVKEEENMTFEDAYDMCNVEMQCRYNYLDELLRNIDDETMYLTEEIEKAKVDEEVAEKMWDSGFAEAREELVSANREGAALHNRLQYLENEYEIVYDLYDQILLGILANIE